MAKRKTFKLKKNAKKAAKRSGRKVYRVKHGYRLGKC
jgi:hypothetical protein